MYYNHVVTPGACSGITTRAIVSPLDVVKIRFQLQIEPIGRVSWQLLKVIICIIYKTDFKTSRKVQGHGSIVELFVVRKILIFAQLTTSILQKYIGSSNYTGVWRAMYKLYHEEGVKVFWKGHSASQVRIRLSFELSSLLLVLVNSVYCIL